MSSNISDKAQNNKVVRIAFIGAGNMANSVHYPSVSSFNDVKIVAICDIDEERMNKTAEKYGIENKYADYRVMIEKENPDGVFIIGPPTNMYDVIVWCIKKQQNIFTEKPLGLNWHQTMMLVELSEKFGVITQVCHQRRSSPLLKKMRELCLEKGPITHAVCEFYKCAITPTYSALDHLHDDCSHSVDTLRWICKGEIIEVDSHCKRIGTPDINWVIATLGFDNGSTGCLINSWASGRRVFRVEMHSPGIYTDAEVEAKAYLYSDNDYSGVEYDTKKVAGSNELYIYGGFQNKCREFIDSLISKKEVTSSPFRDVAKTMKVVETIIAQAVLKGE